MANSEEQKLEIEALQNIFWDDFIPIDLESPEKEFDIIRRRKWIQKYDTEPSEEELFILHFKLSTAYPCDSCQFSIFFESKDSPLNFVPSVAYHLQNITAILKNKAQDLIGNPVVYSLVESLNEYMDTLSIYKPLFNKDENLFEYIEGISKTSSVTTPIVSEAQEPTTLILGASQTDLLLIYPKVTSANTKKVSKNNLLKFERRLTDCSTEIDLFQYSAIDSISWKDVKEFEKNNLFARRIFTSCAISEESEKLYIFGGVDYKMNRFSLDFSMIDLTKKYSKIEEILNSLEKLDVHELYDKEKPTWRCFNTFSYFKDIQQDRLSHFRFDAFIVYGGLNHWGQYCTDVLYKAVIRDGKIRWYLLKPQLHTVDSTSTVCGHCSLVVPQLKGVQILYTFGGMIVKNNCNIFSNRFLLYNIGKNEWSDVYTAISDGSVSIPAPRAGAMMIAIYNKIYIFGGHDAKTVYHDMYCYEIDTNLFYAIPIYGLTVAISSGHMVRQNQDSFFIFGGWNHEGWNNSVYEFSLQTNRWTIHIDSSSSTQECFSLDCVIPLMGDVFLFLGGKLKSSFKGFGYHINQEIQEATSNSKSIPLPARLLQFNQNTDIIQQRRSVCLDWNRFFKEAKGNHDMEFVFLGNSTQTGEIIIKNRLYVHKMILDSNIRLKEHLEELMNNQSDLLRNFQKYIKTNVVANEDNKEEIKYVFILNEETEVWSRLLEFVYSKIIVLDKEKPLKTSIVKRLNALASLFDIKLLQHLCNGSVTFDVIMGESLDQTMKHVVRKLIYQPNSVFKSSSICEIQAPLRTNIEEGEELEMHSLYAHKGLLSIRSEYFRAIFESNFSESITNTVVIEHVSLEGMKQLLHYLYTGYFTQIDGSFVIELFLAAHQYGLVGVISLLRKEIRNYINDIEVAAQVLRVAEFIADESLKKFCIVYLAKQYSSKREAIDQIIESQQTRAEVFSAFYTLTKKKLKKT